jgi:hypothetical protein
MPVDLWTKMALTLIAVSFLGSDRLEIALCRRWPCSNGDVRSQLGPMLHSQ